MVTVCLDMPSVHRQVGSSYCDSQKGYENVFTVVWYAHLEHIYIFMVFVELVNALILLEISCWFTRNNK